MRISCALLRRISTLLLMLCFLLPFEIRIQNHLLGHHLELIDRPMIHTIYGFEQKIGTILLFITVLLFILNFLRDSQRVKKSRAILSSLLLIGIALQYFEIVFEWTTGIQPTVAYGFYVLCTLALINLIIQLRCRI